MMAKMNAMNLYVTTTQIILKSNPNNPNSWQDLYRLIPYLRNSLCCVVCGYLLVDPMSPSTAKCQHHQCKQCQGGRKKIKPMCLQCKDGVSYSENKLLRTLLQCYKRMCTMLINSCIYKELAEQASLSGAGSLISLIKEGEAFEDEYKSTIGLPKSTYSILPCVYTNSSTQTAQQANANAQIQGQRREEAATVYMGNPKTSMYSVLYAGTGNKITIRRKAKLDGRAGVKRDAISAGPNTTSGGAIFKKPILLIGTGGGPGNKQSQGASATSTQKERQRRGCRCGNATATPGKLTCCGQRCPCYVDGKACLECRCRGCRNPHAADGSKVIPHYLQVQDYHQQQPQQQVKLVQQTSAILQTHIHTMPQATEHSSAFLNTLNTLKIELDPVRGLCSSPLSNIPTLSTLSLDQLNDNLQIDADILL